MIGILKIDATHIEPKTSLLTRFNNKDCSAFGEVYMLYINELLGFSKKLFRHTGVDYEDVVHDIFVFIWNSKKLIFNDESALKAYIYVSIKNKFKDFIRHNSCVLKYSEEQLDDNDFMVYQIAESETLSLINRALNMLPTECAKVFKLHIDGWNSRDIATYLGKSERTILIQKQKSISILKKKLSGDKLFIITLLLS